MASRKDVVAGGASVEIRAVDYTKQVFSKVASNLSSIGSSALKLGSGMLGAAATAAAGLTAFTIAVAGSAAAIDDAAKRTGVGVEALQELRYAGEMNATSFEGIVKGLRKLNEAMASDTGRKALEELGLSLVALDAMSPEDRLQAVAEAVSKITDPTKQAAAAASVFGDKVASELLPMLQEGGVAMGKFRTEAHQMGQVLSGDAVNGLATLDDAVVKVMGGLRSLAGILASQLAPYIEPVVSGVASAVAAFSKWIAVNPGFVGALVTGIGVLGAAGVAVMAFGAALIAVSTIISACMTVIGGLTFVFGAAAAPVSIIIAILTGFAAAAGAAAVALAFLATPFLSVTSAGEGFGGVLEWLNGVVNTVSAAIQQTFGSSIQGVIDAFKNGDLESAASIAFMAVQLAAMVAWGKILDGANWMIDGILGSFKSLVPGLEGAMKAMEKAIDVKKQSIKVDIEAAAQKQASIKESQAAKANADAEAAAAKSAAEVAAAAAPVAAAADAAASTTSDLFSTAGGASQAGASAYLGGVEVFKPLETEAKKTNQLLTDIKKKVGNGVGIT